MPQNCLVIHVARNLRLLARAEHNDPHFVWVKMVELWEMLTVIWPWSEQSCACGKNGAAVYIALLQYWIDCIDIHALDGVDLDVIAAHEAQLMILLNCTDELCTV